MTRQDVMEVMNSSDFTREALNDMMTESMEIGIRALIHLQDGNMEALHKEMYAWFFRNSAVLAPLIERYANELDGDMKKAVC